MLNKFYKFCAIIEMFCLSYFSYVHDITWMIVSGAFCFIEILLIGVIEPMCCNDSKHSSKL